MAHRCFVICLVLSLCTSVSISANVFISIDCGSSLPYREDGIAWVGDDDYVKTGESRSVTPSYSLGHVEDTLRVFTTGNKNCYHIDSVKPGRVLVRATFYYGNYDGKSSPPTFALQFDGNAWDTVLTSSTEYYYYEVTYVTQKDFISVCVAQTEEEQFPFITTLEVRSLESDMYLHVDVSYPLFQWSRVAFGVNTTIRYPDDFYDRLWGSGSFGNGSIQVQSNALFSENILHDRPPPAVFKNAITATTSNGSFKLLMEFPIDETHVYINWYFSEITQLQPNQIRSFQIFMGNESISEPILPPYEDYVEMYISDIKVSSKTTFSLVPTNVSTLPPVISAMEVFLIGDFPLTNGTDKNDVQGLASLQDSFDVLKSWSGDPCLPAPYTWDWINCNSDPMPRVTALLLGSYGLLGLVPDFSSMTSLQTIDFHNSSLQGPIPEFLGTFPFLKTLNLANNELNGSIPASLSTKKGLILTVAGNPDLCILNTSCQIPATASPPPPPVKSSTEKDRKNILELLLAAIIPSMIIL